MEELPTRGSYGTMVLAVAAVVLAVGGVMAVMTAMTVPEHAPQPPPSAFGSLEVLVGDETPAVSMDLKTPPNPGSPSVSKVPTPTPPPAAPVGALVLSPSLPVAIDIAAIGVHSELQYLGLTDGNMLEVPARGPLYDEAAWYKYSSLPGSPGPAVILGHVDSAANGPSVFFHLGDLQPGDEVLVTRADGLVAVFIVNGVRSYPKDQFPTELVYGPTDRSTLRLITCGGEFDEAAGHYVSNIVVFASLIGSRQPFVEIIPS